VINKLSVEEKKDYQVPAYFSAYLNKKIILSDNDFQIRALKFVQIEDGGLGVLVD